MRTLVYYTALVLTISQAALSQITVSRPVDPSKPRDGFGFGTEMALKMSAGKPQRDYPRIRTIHPGTPAEKAGLMAGDVILSADGHDLVAEIVSFSPVAGTTMTLRILRGNEIREFKITSVRLYTPPDSLAPAPRTTPPVS